MPVEVMKKVIGILPEEATIIDCFMGANTTGLACKLLGRNYIGIEIDKTYFEEAKKRIKENVIWILKNESKEFKREIMQRSYRKVKGKEILFKK